MKIFITIIILFTSCTLPVKRTKYTDPVMRVLLDPDSIQEDHHARIQRALVESGKWQVVDRARGMEALKKEQDNLHVNEGDRYQNEQKYAHWGRLYGVGGVIIAQADCQMKSNLFGKVYKACLQHLSIVNASTSEVIAAVEARSDSETGIIGWAPDWDEAVEKLNTAFPTHYDTEKAHDKLQEYQLESKHIGERMERRRK